MALKSSNPPMVRVPEPGEVLAGKYRLERLLKQGGMGSVWVATHVGLETHVAVKFMDPRRVASPEARIRFSREAKAAAQVRSTNIVQIFDHGVDRGVPYIAMELLDGEDLGARLKRVGKLSLDQASRLLYDLSHALGRAHSAGIVHRDLKPENIFLAKDGPHEVTKVLDFGIAVELQPDASPDTGETHEGIVLGTPYFMSPEQVRGRAHIDHRSDLWSLGVILFRAVTGMRPFGRGAPADVIVQICSDPIPRASKVAPHLPKEVDRFFERALARELDKRYSSAKEMYEAFVDLLGLHYQVDPNEVSTERRIAVESPSRVPIPGPPPLPKLPPIVASDPPASASSDPPLYASSNPPDKARRSADDEPTRVDRREPSVSRVVAAETPPPPPATDITLTGSRPLAVAETPVIPTATPGPAQRTGTALAANVPVAPPEPGAPARRSWIAIAMGAVALVGVGAILATVLRQPPPSSGFAPTPTLVVTAGTVLLMSPTGQAPSRAPAEPTPAASPSIAASATPTVTASVGAAPSSTDSKVAVVAPASQTAKSTAAPPSTSKPSKDAPKTTPTATSTGRDLGY